MNESHAAFIVARATERADQYWGMLDRRLAKSGPWLMGDAFSALDIYAFMLSLWGRPSEAALHAKFSACGESGNGSASSAEAEGCS